MKLGDYYQSKTDKRNIVQIKGMSDIKSDGLLQINIMRHSDLYFEKTWVYCIEEFLEEYKFCDNKHRKLSSIEGYEGSTPQIS